MNDVTRASLAEAVINLKKKLDKKSLLLARAEEKVLVLEARQEEVGHMLMALRQEKVMGCCGVYDTVSFFCSALTCFGMIHDCSSVAPPIPPPPARLLTPMQ